MKKQLVCLVLFALWSTFAQAKSPNVVLFLIDDLGWMDLSCQGSTFYETPHIDQLAENGMRFTNGYAACAVCSPTRASVQTGRYPGRLYVTDWIRSRFQGGGIPSNNINPSHADKNKWKGAKVACPPNALWMELEEITLAELLKSKSYATCYIGKWHLGADAWYPEQQGFDYNFGGCDYGQPPSYFDPYNNPKSKNPMLAAGIPTLPGRKKGEYLTDREGDEAVGFIRDHKDQAFFLQLSTYAVHTPIQAKADVAAKYTAKKKTSKQTRAKYAAMVESVDDAVGRVVNTIEELGLTDNTIFIFTSDNGGLDRNNNPTDNAPLRSGKGYAYEGGIRVPWIISWPGVTKPGSLSDEPVTSVDILPTVIAALGIESVNELDGIDLKPALTGGKLNRDAIYWHFPHYRHAPGPYSIIRSGDWKYIKWYEGPTALFNLKKDIGEANNLAETMPGKVAELNKKLMAHLKSINAKIPYKK